MTNANGMAGKGYYAEGARGFVGPLNPPARDKVDAALAKTFATPEQSDGDIVTTVEQLLALPETTAFLMADGRIGRTRRGGLSYSVLLQDGGGTAVSTKGVPLPVKVVWRPDRPQRWATTTSERTQS